MTADDYKRRIAALELTQEAAGELFGATGRTGQTWATSGPPKPVAMVLLAVGKLLDRLARQVILRK
jgi:hypothetical protein